MGKSWTDCQLARLITADHWSFCPIPSRLEFCNWLVWASSLAFSTPCQSTPAILSPEERGEVIKANSSEQTSHSEASFLQAINYSGILLPILRKRNYCLFSRVQIKCILEAAYLIKLDRAPILGQSPINNFFPTRFPMMSKNDIYLIFELPADMCVLNILGLDLVLSCNYIISKKKESP